MLEGGQVGMFGVSEILLILPKKSQDQTLPLGRIGNPLHGSSKRLFFVWSWTSRAYIIYIFLKPTHIYFLMGGPVFASLGFTSHKTRVMWVLDTLETFNQKEV